MTSSFKFGDSFSSTGSFKQWQRRPCIGFVILATETNLLEATYLLYPSILSLYWWPGLYPGGTWNQIICWLEDISRGNLKVELRGGVKATHMPTATGIQKRHLQQDWSGLLGGQLGVCTINLDPIPVELTKIISDRFYWIICWWIITENYDLCFQCNYVGPGRQPSSGIYKITKKK